ncbi:MAG: ribonuclease HIII [bacterium]|nr:ribonuclease HIII [Myxococcales bacterium]MCB9543501.1 ribonuclease HIII [Myxococcales bacterium]
MSSYTIKLDPIEAPKTRRFFEEHGFELREAPHAFWQARGPDCIATFYTSGKLLLQGKEADVYRGLMGDETPEARPYWRALQKHPKPGPVAWIGTDEAGKGDYFGPLTVAGVIVRPDDLEILATLGVDDSKAVADGKVAELDKQIQGLCASEVLYISPATYNRMHSQMRTVNAVMAWAHAKVIHALLARTEGTRPDWILTDRFADDRVMVRALGELPAGVRFAQWPKAEEDPAVAAASVLARAAYLRGLASLSKRFGVALHGGAGAPALAAGRRFLATVGREQLGEVAKLHFDTTRQIGG